MGRLAEIGLRSTRQAAGQCRSILNEKRSLEKHRILSKRINPLLIRPSLLLITQRPVGLTGGVTHRLSSQNIHPALDQLPDRRIVLRINELIVNTVVLEPLERFLAGATIGY